MEFPSRTEKGIKKAPARVLFGSTDDGSGKSNTGAAGSNLAAVS
jgi:hypothetical protein